MMWTKSEEELRHFRNLTNQKHQSIKFGFKFSKYKIEFFDTQIYKDKNNRPQLQTRLLKKTTTTDCQNYLQAKSAYPYSLKKIITLWANSENKNNMFQNWRIQITYTGSIKMVCGKSFQKSQHQQPNQESWQS